MEASGTSLPIAPVTTAVVETLKLLVSKDVCSFVVCDRQRHSIAPQSGKENRESGCSCIANQRYNRAQEDISHFTIRQLNEETAAWERTDKR